MQPRAYMLVCCDLSSPFTLHKVIFKSLTCEVLSLKCDISDDELKQIHGGTMQQSSPNKKNLQSETTTEKTVSNLFLYQNSVSKHEPEKRNEQSTNFTESSNPKKFCLAVWCFCRYFVLSSCDAHFLLCVEHKIFTFCCCEVAL